MIYWVVQLKRHLTSSSSMCNVKLSTNLTASWQPCQFSWQMTSIQAASLSTTAYYCVHVLYKWATCECRAQWCCTVNVSTCLFILALRLMLVTSGCSSSSSPTLSTSSTTHGLPAAGPRRATYNDESRWLSEWYSACVLSLNSHSQYACFSD